MEQAIATAFEPYGHLMPGGHDEPMAPLDAYDVSATQARTPAHGAETAELSPPLSRAGQEADLLIRRPPWKQNS
jgi:hypothetical protein